MNDDVVPTLSIGDVSVTEGNSGTITATFPVTLSAAATSAVTVTYATANGTATAGSDYAATGGTLTFPAGTTTQSIGVTVNGDTTVEPNETFTVTLTSPSGATLVRATATGTIVNDDTAPLPTLSIADVSVTEGNSGTKNATFVVTLSAAATGTVTANYATANGTATAGSDYVAASGTFTFTAGQTSKSINVVVNGDTTVEPNETFTVNLSSATGATITRAQGAGTIQNDDGAAGGAQPVVWTSLVNVSASGNSLTDLAASNVNAGAGSTRQFTSGDGYVEFTASETTTYRMVGLSTGNPDASYNLDFGIALAPAAQVFVVEKGVSMGSFGTYKTGDVLRVAAVGGVVKYSKNGTVFYSSAKAPTYPLLVDTWLYSQGATINSVAFTGAQSPHSRRPVDASTGLSGRRIYVTLVAPAGALCKIWLFLCTCDA